MSQPADATMWTVRRARPQEAEKIAAVLRASIRTLCQADHRNDPAVLSAWLANKTAISVTAWIRADPNGVWVALDPNARIAGAASGSAQGVIHLNYVAPFARGRGVSTRLLRALEARAAEAGAKTCSLVSTLTALRFYQARGYRVSGHPIMSFGSKQSFPIERPL